MHVIDTFGGFFFFVLISGGTRVSQVVVNFFPPLDTDQDSLSFFMVLSFTAVLISLLLFIETE